MPEEPIGGGRLGGFGATAFGPVSARAVESRRPDRLFDDPLAERFAALAAPASNSAPPPADSARSFSTFSEYVAVRTRAYDDWVLASAVAGVRQIVLPAAGFDTRAFRLAWPDGTRLFEIDTPDVLALKESVLAEAAAVPRCERIVVPADLREGEWGDALLAAGMRLHEPTAWLAEGIFIYLGRGETERLLARISELSAPGSRVACERTGQGGLPQQALKQALDALGPQAARRMWEMRNAGPPLELAEWLGTHGWDIETTPLDGLAESYGRTTASVEDVGVGRGGTFVTAEREG